MKVRAIKRAKPRPYLLNLQAAIYRRANQMIERRILEDLFSLVKRTTEAGR